MGKKTGQPADVNDALEGELVAADPEALAVFHIFDQDWVLQRRPPVLMIARMQRVKTNPQSLAVFDQLMEHTLGDQYDDFMARYYEACPADGDDTELFTDVLGAIMSAATGRPPA